MKLGEITEAIKRPELNVLHTERELEQAYQQLIGICDAYEVTIEMQKESMKEAFLAGYQTGEIKGFDDGSSGHNRVYNSREETPEEAYEYWLKHER